MSLQTLVARVYTFEAAHFLPLVPEWHKCKRMHGHNYEIEVTLTGDLDRRGFIIDFWEMDELVDPLIEMIDHRVLNDIEGLENPTAENIAHWFFLRIQDALTKYTAGFSKPVQVGAVRCWETKNCYAIVTKTTSLDQFRHLVEEESPA